MSLEIDAINHDQVYRAMIKKLSAHHQMTDKKPEMSDQEIEELIKSNQPDIDLESIKTDLSQIMKDMDLMNKKVKLSFNQDINRIIITILDKESNEVIKQIPSIELQNLASHLKKAIGLLFDNMA